ncbi:DUF6011 domain-containing protein [Actinomadura hibisca]|uniref:DUF6011 domain-containing protein n=1 Tax=Actinomadura hibisca TaxID=68565 RepID=UPI000836B47F|nr:DUF6011 domain-containing protein [Actinomadura hibisca]
MTKTAKPQTATCKRCHATLRSARSVTRGYGDHCWTMQQRETAVARLSRAFKGAEKTRRDALELLEDQALVPTRHDGQFLAVSSDGDTVYLVDTVERSCTCKGHGRTGRCYHLVAADTVEITTTPAREFALAA